MLAANGVVGSTVRDANGWRKQNTLSWLGEDFKA